jgi:hypothetical protein
MPFSSSVIPMYGVSSGASVISGLLIVDDGYARRECGRSQHLGKQHVYF